MRVGLSRLMMTSGCVHSVRAGDGSVWPGVPASNGAPPTLAQCMATASEQLYANRTLAPSARRRLAGTTHPHSRTAAHSPTVVAPPPPSATRTPPQASLKLSLPPHTHSCGQTRWPTWQKRPPSAQLPRELDVRRAGALRRPSWTRVTRFVCCWGCLQGCQRHSGLNASTSSAMRCACPHNWTRRPCVESSPDVRSRTPSTKPTPRTDSARTRRSCSPGMQGCRRSPRCVRGVHACARVCAHACVCGCIMVCSRDTPIPPPPRLPTPQRQYSETHALLRHVVSTADTQLRAVISSKGWSVEERQQFHDSLGVPQAAALTGRRLQTDLRQLMAKCRAGDEAATLQFQAVAHAIRNAYMLITGDTHRADTRVCVRVILDSSRVDVKVRCSVLLSARACASREGRQVPGCCVLLCA